MSSYPPPPSQDTQARLGLPALAGEDGGSYALRYQERRPVPDPPGMLWRGIARVGVFNLPVAIDKDHVPLWFARGEWWRCSNGDEEERADIFKAWAIDMAKRAEDAEASAEKAVLITVERYDGYASAEKALRKAWEAAAREHGVIWTCAVGEAETALRALGVDP